MPATPAVAKVTPTTPAPALHTQPKVARTAVEKVTKGDLRKLAAEADAQKQADRANERAAKAQQKADEAALKQAQATSKKDKKLAKPVALQSEQMTEGPALPISVDKQQRLAELLRKYKADEITAEQYHKDRSKILTEP
jgi:hypothetical protein